MIGLQNLSNCLSTFQAPEYLSKYTYWIILAQSRWRNSQMMSYAQAVRNVWGIKEASSEDIPWYYAAKLDKKTSTG